MKISIVERRRNICSSERGDNLFVALLIIALLLFGADNWRPVEQMDDAFISFQYARNLVAGHGLVFNVGERVEGFTNLSWTLLVALGMKMGFAAPAVGRALSLMSGATLLVASGIYVALLLPRTQRWVAGFAPLILLASNAFACWTVSGLETLLFGFFIVGALCSSLRDQIAAAVFYCMLATLTRPEGAMYAAAILGGDWLLKNYRLPTKSFPSVWLNSYPIMAYLLFVACYTGWRWWYYGELLPNTFYAKVGGVPYARGVSYIANFLADGPAVLLLPASVAALAMPRYRIAVICMLLTVVYCVAIGGDVFRHGRFLLPLYPALIAGALAGTSWMYAKWRPAGLALALLLPLSIGWSLYGPLNGEDYRGAANRQFPQLSKRASAQDNTGLGGIGATKHVLAAIAASVPAVKSVACIGIGQIAFFSNNLYVLDLLGLVDKHIARSAKRVAGDVNILPGHQRTDADYVFGRRPDVILIPQKDTALALQNIPAVYELWHSSRLDQLYYWDAKIPGYRLRANFTAEPDAS